MHEGSVTTKHKAVFGIVSLGLSVCHISVFYLCACMYVCVCVYVCMCLCVHECVYMYICEYIICVFVCVGVNVSSG